MVFRFRIVSFERCDRVPSSVQPITDGDDDDSTCGSHCIIMSYTTLQYTLLLPLHTGTRILASFTHIPARVLHQITFKTHGNLTNAHTHTHKRAHLLCMSMVSCPLPPLPSQFNNVAKLQRAYWRFSAMLCLRRRCLCIVVSAHARSRHTAVLLIVSWLASCRLVRFALRAK